MSPLPPGRPPRHVVARFALLTAATVAAVVAVTLSPWGTALRDREAVQGWVAGFGLWAPLAGVLLGVLQVVGLPLPASILALINGYIFGAVLGPVIGLVGGTLGALLAIGLARWLGRPLLERLLGSETARWLDYYAAHRGLLYLAIVTFLIPGVPDNMIFFAMGINRQRSPLPLLGLAIVLRLPATVIMGYVGAHLAG